MPAELEVIAAENRRLLREVKTLRARLATLEASRWWRVHPRRLLQRRRQPTELAIACGAVRGPAPERQRPEPIETMTARFRNDVIARGSFRSDLFTWNIQTWERFLGHFEGRPVRILEVGSFEGMSACYLLWRLPEARITCIDTFGGSPEHLALGGDVSALEAAFDRNVALIDSTRVRKLVGRSAAVLPNLISAAEEFDLIYIDASHFAIDVIVDAALAWKLLAPGGTLVFDDYDWSSPLGEDPLLRPGPAIDAFLDLLGDRCEVLLREKQVVVRAATMAMARDRVTHVGIPANL